MVFDFPPSGHLNLDDWSGLDQRRISFTDSRAGAVASGPRAGRGQSRPARDPLSRLYREPLPALIPTGFGKQRTLFDVGIQLLAGSDDEESRSVPGGLPRRTERT